MKIIIVPHTHWDREWYFTSETSQQLLNFNLDNSLNYDYPIDKFYLDGQVSIVEDYLKHANVMNKQKFIKLVKEKKFIVGPLYSQPDVFNSLGETTMRNIEIAQKLLKQWNFENTKTFYCPDTFGFGDNLPQILNHYGFKDFVFWRGVAKTKDDADYFKWQGVDGSLLNCYRLKFGYWTLGSLFDWKNLDAHNLEQSAKKFIERFEQSSIYAHFKQQAPKQNNQVLFPFGGDQAPIHSLTNVFFKMLNKYSKDEWVIDELDSFFNQSAPTKTITGILDYGYDSKIHRTIGSTRYDFKKLFRENEINLYHQLEALELYYHHCDPKYVICNDEIIKQLCLMQAHDVLGGCVTDNVYLASYQKLLNIKEHIETKNQMLLKQLALQLKLHENNLLIFNPYMHKHANNVIHHKIYTKQLISGIYDDKACKIIVLNSQKYIGIDDTYVTELLIINKQLMPLNLHIIDLTTFKPFNAVKKTYQEPELFNQFVINYDGGDLFDADENFGLKLKIQNVVISSDLSSYEEIDVINIKGKLCIGNEINHYAIEIIKTGDDQYINIIIDNHMNDIIVKWTPFKTFQQPNFLQHLAIQNYAVRKIDNWVAEKYKENPLNVEKNSGIIFDTQKYICTRGNNEFKYEDGQVQITLYRSTGMLGKPNLLNRPGVASGLTDHRIQTPLGQLNQTLSFDFKIGTHHSDVANKLNSFYRLPMIFAVNSKNLIESKMERFVFLQQAYTIKQLNLDIPYGFISSLKLNDNYEVTATFVNIDDSHNINYNKLKQVTI